MNFLEIYQKKFKCINHEEMWVRGSFDSESARLISIRLNRCVESETQKCKSDEEITQFFRNKFLVFLYNERRFDSNYFEYDSIVSQAQI